MERGYFGRDPYPISFYFDHLGTHGRSAVARIGMLKLAAPITSDGRALVSAFRSQMAVAFNSLDPFRSEDFRNYFKRLCLLPLPDLECIFLRRTRKIPYTIRILVRC